LPGGELGHLDSVLSALQSRHPSLPDALLRGLAHRHGSRAAALLGDAQDVGALGVHFGAQLYQREVDHMVAHEWVHEADDVLWRRSHLGLKLDGVQRAALAQYIDGCMKHKDDPF